MSAKGAKSLRGLHVDILRPVVVDALPSSSDIVIDEPYVSASQLPALPSRDPLWWRKPWFHKPELWLMVTSPNSLLRFATQTKSQVGV